MIEDLQSNQVEQPDIDSTPPDPRRWIAFATTLAAGFMDLLDVTIVNVAVPTIQEDLGARYAQIEWIIAAYVLAFAAILITGGRLGDLYGHKRIFLVGMVLFTVASAACGLSADPTMLIGARFLQGLAAGLMVPQILAILRESFPERERAKAIAVYSAVCGSATAVGLALGALLVEWDLFGLSWRPIFLVNIPIGIITLIAAWRWMDESRAVAPPRLDLVGVALVTAAILLLTYPLTEGRRLGWPAWTFVMIGASVVALVSLIGYERRRQRVEGSPLIDLDLFQSRPFTLGLISWLLFWICFGGFFLVWTLLMQAGLGWSPLRAGLTSLFFAVATGIGAGASASVLAPRFGRRVLIVGGLVTCAGFTGYGALVQHYDQGTTTWQMVVPLVAIGLGFGFVVAPTIDLVLGQVPTRAAGAASGLLNTGQQLGIALGVALVGIVFFTQLDHDSARGADEAAARVRVELAATDLPGPVQVEIADGFRACVRDRSAQVDPSEEPESCRAPADPATIRMLTEAGEHATAINFANTFRYTLWYGAGIMALLSFGFLALPRNAKPVQTNNRGGCEMVEARTQQVIACLPEEFLEFAMDVERYAEVDDKIGRFDWVRRDGNLVEFKFRPTMPGLPGPAPKMIAQGRLTPGQRVDVGLAPLPHSRLWHRLMKFSASFVCEPAENGTLVTRTMTAELIPAVRWLVDPILRRNLPGNLETEMTQAKTYLERHTDRD